MRNDAFSADPESRAGTSWSDEELVRYLYGEGAPAWRAELAAAAAILPELALRLADWQRTLAAVAWPPAPERGADYGERVWKSVAPRLRESTGPPIPERRFALRRWRLVLPAAAAATLLLVIGFVAGRLSRTSPAPLAGGAVAAVDVAGESAVIDVAPVAVAPRGSRSAAQSHVQEAHRAAPSQPPSLVQAEPDRERAVVAITAPAPVASGTAVARPSDGEPAAAAAAAAVEVDPQREPPPLLAGLTPQGRERIFAAVVSGHLERAERLLLEVANGEQSRGDLARETSARAAVLVAANRLYRGAAADARARDVERLLSELEARLLELAHLSADDPAGFAAVRTRLASDGLMFRLRVVESKRQAPSRPLAPRPLLSSPPGGAAGAARVGADAHGLGDAADSLTLAACPAGSDSPVPTHLS